MKKPGILLYGVLTFAVISCDKKKKDDPQPPTQTQMLSARKWQIRSFVLISPNQPDVDLYALIRPCSVDDFVEFATPNTFRADEGLIKCGPNDPQTRLGIWALDNNDKRLTVTFSGSTTSYSVDELTDTSLKLTTTRIQSNGTVSTQKNTYVAIP